MRLFTAPIAALLLLAIPASGQMTPQQREFDFQSMLAVYAKRYGPANWKQEALGVDIFDASQWMTRVRAAKTDVEYFQICAEFVARLQDGHSSYRAPSNYFIDSGLSFDIYDGKVLVEAISRPRYPLSSPLAIGDELVSIDARPVNEILDEFVKTRGFGNARGSRRLAASALGARSQTFYPTTNSVPDESDFLLRKADGTDHTVRVTWTKSGVPVTAVGPVPTPRFAAHPGMTADEVMRPLLEMRNWAVPARDLALGEQVLTNENGEEFLKNFVIGFGGRNPYFTVPAGFNVRLGRNPADQFYSGTYMADGLRIGYLRIPHFGANPALAIPQLDAEVAFLRANTDGLVLDVSRNTGGGCIGLDYAARLIPQTFWFFGEQLRPTLGLRSNIASLLDNARQLRLDQWVIDTYQSILDELNVALKENRAMTGPRPACTTAFPQDLATAFRPPTFDNEPRPGAYDKPMIFLADELSVSFGDIFPAMMQDNQRGPIVGMRTAGAGGSISTWPAGSYSEALTSNTNSLVVRRRPIAAPGLPMAALIENIGVLPDIELDYMTRDNLLQNGRPFVDAFTRIMVDHIRQTRQ